MNSAEKAECILILATTLVIGIRSSVIPDPVETGYLILSLGLLFLFQTLLRDLWLLWKQRGLARESMPARSCMCLESGVGFIPVILAAVLLSSGVSRPVSVADGVWTASAAVVMFTGYLLKDYVIELNPWRIRKDPDHINMRFTWRRK